MAEEGCLNRGASSAWAMDEEALMAIGAMAPGEAIVEGEGVVLAWKKEQQGSQAWDRVDLNPSDQDLAEKS